MSKTIEDKKEEEYVEKYKVLMNHEEQYCIWKDFLDVPKGWTQVGPVGSKEEVLAYVKEVWTDMRPKSLRERVLPPPPKLEDLLIPEDELEQ